MPIPATNTLVRVAFAPSAPAGSRILRTFTAPREFVAFEPLDDGGSFEITIAPPGKRNEKSPDQAIVLRRRDERVEWHGTKAVVKARRETADGWLPGVIEFAFLNDELHSLERELAPIETSAETDVALAYRIKSRDSKDWPRIGDTIESLSRLRLRFARLEPCSSVPSPSLSGPSRNVLETLIERTRFEDRLGAFSDRLEACEDLYEGASDRIADFRWYRSGNRLELWIIVFLVIEVILMLFEVYYRHQEHLELMGVP